VQAQPGRKSSQGDLRRRLERLDHLPIRPITARHVMSLAADEPSDDGPSARDASAFRNVCDLDPGWVLWQTTLTSQADPVHLVAERAWWPSGSIAGPRAETFQRLWRHSVAVSLAARWLAREAGSADGDGLVRASFLHGLGRWAVASVDADWIAGWLDEPEPRRRRRELDDLGTDLCDLGRRLAERWGCDPLVVDSAWLHGRSHEPLNRLATQPDRLALIQQAFAWAEKTPWALSPAPSTEPRLVEPRLRILIAEVQSRCGALFAAADATAHEERMTRKAARLVLRLAEASRARATQDRVLRALAASESSETRESWADRAGVLWCEEPEVNAARIVWTDEPSWPNRTARAETVDRAEDAASHVRDPAPRRGPTHVLPLRVRGRVQAEIQLWCDGSQPDLPMRLAATSILPAWGAWASWIDQRARLERRLDTLVAAVREHGDEGETRARDARLAALAEFAAGAGHELNNPLAVIVGRTQLLLGRLHDSDSTRSLRIILNQAQRTHRILRDLMFVARPPVPRPRACRTGDVLRGCLASFQDECDARGIRMISELDPADPPKWTDPDSLAHLAEILVRNAIQATPSGGKVQVRSGWMGDELTWWVADSGRGISATEGAHLFDPFYCGREAGRGLGLGLPRAARIAALAGGMLRWSSSPGQGSVFQVQLPMASPPEQQVQDRALDRDAGPRVAPAPLN
jgi:signal transduction histidine kinase